jgi:hypothetical protein
MKQLNIVDDKLRGRHCKIHASCYVYQEAL